ncbi:MAG TPA: glycosyltransferase family 61 protein [Acetobacteraceae bacterium]|nr:glycosyltransferase family 61 protein [Acetobacteraceae bacterium]
MRSRLRAFHAKTVEAAGDVVVLARGMLTGSEPVNIGLLLDAYICGVGSFADPTRYRLRQMTDEIGQFHALLPPDGSFFEHVWSVKPSAAERYCPDAMPHLFTTRPNAGLEATQVLEPCPNEAIDLRLPTPLGGLIRRPYRAPFRIYATNDAIAYVHPFQYQVLSKDRSALWISGSPRALSRCSIPDLQIEQTDRNIVIVQDRFVFANLCHLLFDGVTRILHYIETFGSSGNDLFVLGSIPGEFQALVCATLSEKFGIAPENLCFPTGPRLLSTTRKCFWFSDQMEGHAHPAQMAHPRSVSALAAFCAGLPAVGSQARRLYISRGDAERRRVANEAELIAALEAQGFTAVQLAKLPAQEQIGLFRGADMVVGPHGMGLTHIIMGTNLGRMIELFHPNAGTDAYAFIARSAGMEYDFIVGTEAPNTPSDFTVDVRRVVDLVGPDDCPVRRPAWHKSANLIPASRTFQGFFPVGASRVEPCAEQMIWGQEARLHRKLGRAVELGRWPRVLISPGRQYTASCWVWIPDNFEGDYVSVQISDSDPRAQQAADLALRGAWQRIYSTGTARQTARCSVSVNVGGPDDCTVMSTCWQFEQGDTPTAYVATG